MEKPMRNTSIPTTNNERIIQFLIKGDDYRKKTEIGGRLIVIELYVRLFPTGYTSILYTKKTKKMDYCRCKLVTKTIRDLYIVSNMLKISVDYVVPILFCDALSIHNLPKLIRIFQFFELLFCAFSSTF